jgi:hypothetical protein
MTMLFDLPALKKGGILGRGHGAWEKPTYALFPIPRLWWTTTASPNALNVSSSALSLRASLSQSVRADFAPSNSRFFKRLRQACG